jgi:hypothetical protein
MSFVCLLWFLRLHHRRFLHFKFRTAETSDATISNKFVWTLLGLLFEVRQDV